METGTFKLNNGISMPSVGFGTYLIDDEKQAVDAVRDALACGYRHIDTAAAYGNEKSVGIAVRESGIARNEIFITTKLWNGDIRKGNTRKAFEKSLELLGMDYVDLYLIHWPADGYAKAWLEMERLYEEGLAKAIGISNFQQHHIRSLMEKATVTPAVNQIECHPYLVQKELRDYCKAMSVLCEAWSPLGGKGAHILADRTIIQLADKYDKQPAQVILRWLLQSGVSSNTKSTHEERIRQNIDIFDFELSGGDIDTINALDKGKRVGPDPDNFNF